jgi:hypothetical protein
MIQLFWIAHSRTTQTITMTPTPIAGWFWVVGLTAPSTTNPAGAWLKVILQPTAGTGGSVFQITLSCDIVAKS